MWRRRLMEEWASGGFTGPTADETIQLSSASIGRSIVLKEILDLGYDDFIEELKQDE